MSIRGAVAELNAEIERVTEIRDSLLQFEESRGTKTVGLPSSPGTAQDKANLKKAAPVKKASSERGADAGKPTKSAKRVVSSETRKKMSDAAKARSAARKAPASK